jgi:hypothetical protein
LSVPDKARIKHLLSLLAQRRAEALRLYEPLPRMEAFHRSLARERLVRGSNRAGKTLTAAVEVARAVTGQDPFDKWPKTNGRFWLVGRDGRHLGQVMYRKLFRGDQFKIVKDPVTGLWRGYRPWTDQGQKPRPAPPLIPARFIAEMAWENKREMTPSLITLVNGWEMLFLSSNSIPGVGSDIDGAWFDEEIENSSWYSETAARLLDRKGRFLWSATPQAATQQLYDLSCRAEVDPNVEEFLALLEDNPHIASEEKLLLAAKLTDEERRVRIGGEFFLTGFRVYPEFAMGIHGVKPFAIPADWCTYVAIDPGHQICAALFVAVPPPGRGDERVYLYDELYLAHCDAEKFGAAMLEKLQGKTPPQEFLIDGHAGRVTEMGSGLTIEEQYARALKKRGLKSFTTGSGFAWGSDDVKAGLAAVRDLLRIRPSGLPTLAVFAERLPKFEWEIGRYRYKSIKTDSGKLPSDEPDKKNDHLMDCARYLAARSLGYVKPRPVKTKTFVQKALEDKKARKLERARRWRRTA